MSDVENVIIIGSGPAGYTAALYTARANLNPLVIEGFAWGGLLQQTTDVENYPGFTEGVMGPELMQKFREQAERFGARLVTDQAERVELASEPGGIHRVWVGDTEHRARTVILAMGAEHKKLGVVGEDELSGRGVSYCATCDAAFFRDAQTVIVGGGDSAMEEAIFLSKFAKKVSVVNRRDEFRASKIMLERARSQPNIEFVTPYTVKEFVAGEKGTLGHATLTQAATGEEREIPVTGVFIAVGHEPQSGPRARAGRARRERLCRHRGQVHPHQAPRRIRCGGPRRPHLPAGDHSRRFGLPGGARRRVVPARHTRHPDSVGNAARRSSRNAVGACRRVGPGAARS